MSFQRRTFPAMSYFDLLLWCLRSHPSKKGVQANTRTATGFLLFPAIIVFGMLLAAPDYEA